MRPVAGLLLVAFLALLAAGCGQASRPEAIVLVTLDTLRADHLGVYGYPRQTSPFLDELARRSVVFDDASSSAPLTTPAHATILTGRHPHRHRLLVNGARLEPQIDTLPEHLLDHGWETAAFVSVRFLNGLERGFEHFDAPRRRTGQPGDELPGGGRPGEEPRYRTAEHTVSRLEQWLVQRRDRRPLFLWIHLYDIHESREVVPISRAYLRRSRRDWRKNRAALVEFVRREMGLDLDGGNPDLARAEYGIQRYDAQIAYTDSQLRWLVEVVAGRLRPQRVVWVFTSDHGEGLGEHGYLGHARYLYREQLRVPLIVHAPGAGWTAGRIDTPVRLLDLAPTLAQLAGAPLPGGWEHAGSSLLPLLRGESDPVRGRPNLAVRAPPGPRALRDGWRRGYLLALREGRWKAIRDDRGEYELYDLEADPHETGRLPPGAALEWMRLQERLEELRRRIDEAGLGGALRSQPEFADDLEALGYL